MAMKVESSDHNNLGLKIEGDLGELQIIEESSEDDDNGDEGRESEKVSTVANIPNSLVKTSNTPSFGSVQVTNSDNVQFGNNTFFNGPVTIKQVIQTTNGVENASYQKTDDDTILNDKHSKNDKLAKPGFQIKPWHKLSFYIAGVIVIASICAIVVISQNKNQQSSNTDNISDGISRNDDCTQTEFVVMEKAANTITIWLTLLILAITLFLWVLYLLLTHGNQDAFWDKSSQKAENEKQPLQYSEMRRADDILIAPDHLRIVSRTDWLAQPVEEEIKRIRQPVPWVIITHTATEGCFTQSACVLSVRLMQTFHIESKRWSDISYNFMVGGDGSAYCGRGWDLIGAHTKGYNHYAIAIAFIGTFNTKTPAKNQIDACRKLIKLGVAEGKIAKDYKLLAHRQLMSTLSPGDKLFDIIKTWPHFFNGSDISTIIPKPKY